MYGASVRIWTRCSLQAGTEPRARQAHHKKAHFHGADTALARAGCLAPWRRTQSCPLRQHDAQCMACARQAAALLPKVKCNPGVSSCFGFWFIATIAISNFLGALIHSFLSAFQLTDWKASTLGTWWHLFPRTSSAFHIWIQTQGMQQLPGSSKTWKLGLLRNVQTYTT